MEYTLIPINANIDLHNHTRGSDGKQKTLRMLLRAARNKKDIVSITDHDSVEEYINLQRDLYSVVETVKGDPSYDPSHIIEVLENIQLLTGTELITSYKGVIIEVLGYGINIEQMRDEIQRLKQSVPQKPYEALYHGFKRIIKENCLTFDHSKLDEAFLKIKTEGKGGVVGPFFEELSRHSENASFLEYEENGQRKQANTLKLFINKHLYNKKSKLFVSMANTRPILKSTIEAIHNSGGIAILAHPGRYMDKFNVLENLDEIISYGLDGIEVYYPDHTYEFERALLAKVREHKIKASGGSDDHHTPKEGNQYDIGRVSVPKIPETKWIQNLSKSNSSYLKNNQILKKYINELKQIQEKRKKKRKTEIEGR